MDGTQFYRPITEELCQGDVFERVPLVFVKESPSLLRKVTLPGKKDGFEMGELLSAAAAPRPGPPLLVAAPCEHTRAILLTYDCEIDKPSAKVLTLALVRLLDPRMPDADRTTIRENRRFAFFYLHPEQEEA